ncbi:MAG: hypothetical protein ACOX32_06175 [Bacteroidaceae bacterium]|jgi:hypothetical protein|nr:hypothetical protein [Bacteroidaceae bacterium]OPZ47652.1 MAG: hypothetical protein BWY95_01346 [Bacteroidetes bacterium ADurb.BinA104]HOD68330.1 hypothetical protein [Bacteroidaceae bacterium]HQL25634.1 hypothetical protein [Bacteroidaceae bacterium]
MDETSTSSLMISENLIRSALKSFSYGSPAEKTINFILNFATTVRAVDDMPGTSGIYSLN